MLGKLIGVGSKLIRREVRDAERYLSNYGKRVEAVLYERVGQGGASARILGAVINLESRLRKTGLLKEYMRTFQENGLHITLVAEGREINLTTSDDASILFALHKNGLMKRLDEIRDFLGNIIAAYAKDKQEIPAGKLNLADALKQFSDAIKGHDSQKRAELEAAFAMQAVKDNLEVEGARAIANKYTAVIELLNKVAGDSLSDAATAIVNTAQQLWPGGNPVLMMYREENGKPVLVPVAVALPQRVLAVGESALNKRLGTWSIPITSNSQNPYVQVFHYGKIRVEKEISLQRHRDVCAGFIDQPITGGMLETMFYGISYPGKNNTLVTAPLVVSDPVTGQNKKIAVFAVLKKGSFSQEDMHVFEALTKSTATMLAQIQWKEELRRAINEARAYAHEREVYADELRMMQERLVESGKLSAMGSMAAVTSHAFKNALMGVAALNEDVQLLVRQLRVAMDIVAVKTRIELAVEQDIVILEKIWQELNSRVLSSRNVLRDSEEVVRGMLSFARIGSGEKQAIPVKDFVRNLIKPLKLKAERDRVGIYLMDKKIEADDAVYIISSELGDLLRNLISNAIESFEGKKESSGMIRLSAERVGDSIVFTIADNGCGVSPENLPRLFSSWGKSAKKQGTGLGMVTVKNIVDANNGTITVTSQLGQGTEFKVAFPAVKAAKKAPGPVKTHLLSRAEASRINIIYVEDEEPIRFSIGRRLEEMGFPLKAFASAEEALEYVAASGDIVPGLIITDQTLKGMPGDAFLRIVYQKFKAIPPRFIIHSGDVAQAADITDMPINWIEKGTDIKRFLEAVSRVVRNDKKDKPNEIDLPDWLKTSPFYAWARFLSHRFNNLITPLYSEEMAGDLDYLRSASKDLMLEFEGLKEFAGRSKKSDFGKNEWGEGQVPEGIKALPKAMVDDLQRRKEATWNKLPAAERYKLAVICMIYCDNVSGYIDTIQSILSKPFPSREEVKRVFEMAEKIRSINTGLALYSPDEGLNELFLHYYEYLAGKR